MNGKVAFLLGSESDKETVEVSRKYFDYFDIELDLRVMSAHRNPDDVSKFAISARDNGYHVLIGAAGTFSRSLKGLLHTSGNRCAISWWN